MKLINVPPKYLNEELINKICKNKDFKREYTRKYKEFFGGGGEPFLRNIMLCRRKTIIL